MLSEAEMVIRVFSAAVATHSREEGGDLAASETLLLIYHHGISRGAV